MTERSVRERPRRGDELGQVAGLETVVVGLLVLIGGVLVIANAWSVVDAKFAAVSAAQEAARTFVKAPAGTDALDAAMQAGQDTLSSLGHTGVGRRIDLITGSLARCATVTFRASVHVPVIVVPWLARAGGGLTVSATHSELVDPFRSGLEGTGPGGAVRCG
jgi:hypothetical protein